MMDLEGKTMDIPQAVYETNGHGIVEYVRNHVDEIYRLLRKNNIPKNDMDTYFATVRSINFYLSTLDAMIGEYDEIDIKYDRLTGKGER